MNWGLWIKGYKDYISTNKDNINTDSISLSDKFILFKEDAAADQYDRVTTLQELSTLLSIEGNSGLEKVTIDDVTAWRLIGKTPTLIEDYVHLQSLEVNGDLRIINGGIYDSEGELGTTGQILSTTDTGIEWISVASGSVVSVSSNNTDQLTVASQTTNPVISLNIDTVEEGNMSLVTSNSIYVAIKDMLLADGSVQMLNITNPTISGDYYVFYQSGLSGGNQFIVIEDLDLTSIFYEGTYLAITTTTYDIVYYVTVTDSYLCNENTYIYIDSVVDLTGCQYIIQSDSVPFSYTPSDDYDISTKIYTDTKVPYTGADSNLDLGTYSLLSNLIYINYITDSEDSNGTEGQVLTNIGTKIAWRDISTATVSEISSSNIDVLTVTNPTTTPILNIITDSVTESSNALVISSDIYTAIHAIPERLGIVYADDSPTGNENIGDWYLAGESGNTAYPNFGGYYVEKFTRLVKVANGWGISTPYYEFESNVLPYVGGRLDVDLNGHTLVGSYAYRDSVIDGNMYLTKDEIYGLVYPVELSSLTYSGKVSVIEIDTSIVNPIFTWTYSGTPENLLLSDNNGQMTDQPVTGSSYSSLLTYIKSTYGSITWTLECDTTSTTTTTTWVYPTYYGKNTTGAIPTDTEIVAGTKSIVITASSVSVNLNTDETQYGWIAVENTQTGSDYTNWYVTALNSGLISSTSFIELKGQVVIGTLTYDVYMFTNPVEFTSTLKLS